MTAERELVERLLDKATAEVGVKESPPNSNRTKYGKWYGLDGNPWCMMFVMWVFSQIGAAAALPKKTASCSDLMNAAKKAGQWVGAQEVQEGDVLIYNFPGNAVKTDHTGICYGVMRTGKKVTGVIAIEGNTGLGNDANGGRVMQRTRGAGVILGAVRPDWAKAAKALGMADKPGLALVAQKVLNGEYGNGDLRVARLRVAGYDPAAVQRVVNALDRGAYPVRVTASFLTIREKPSTDSASLGSLPEGTLTHISEVRDGKGSSLGWGRVSNGWIALDYVREAL